MDHLTDELERMATNIAQYDGDDSDSDIPLDAISGEPPARRAVLNPACSTRRSAKGAPKRPQTTKANYLMRLSGPLSTASQVQAAAGLPTPPVLIQGETDDDGAAASFCRLPQQAVSRLSTWLSETGVPSRKRPAFVRLSEAEKELCRHSPYPTLGVDATLPHHRPNNDTAVYHPLQDEYPVWYFFYGTLADADKLTSLFALQECDRPVLPRAAVQSAAVGTWAGKYKALVDGLGTVEGWAYKVVNKEQEDILRAYETEKYEVVRCRIEIEGEGDVMGCTFRFVDPASLKYFK